MKTLRQLLAALGLVIASFCLLAIPLSTSAQLLPLPDKTSYANLPAPAAGGTAQQQFYELVFGIIQNARYLIGTIAVALIIYAGIRMVLAQGNEEVHTAQRSHILYAIIGLAIVGFSGEIVRIFQVGCDPTVLKIPGQTCTEGGFLKDPNAIIRQSLIFNQQTQYIITFIKYIVGSIAILEIVTGGLKMITQGDQEDKIGVVKKNLVYAFVGLIFIILADTAINKVFFKLDFTRYPSVGGATPGVDSVQGIKEIVSLTNIIVSVVSPLAVLALVGAGILYLTSAGNEDRQGQAKRIIMAVIVGILIMYGAFAIVSTFIGGRFEGGSGTLTQPTGSTITTL